MVGQQREQGIPVAHEEALAAVVDELEACALSPGGGQFSEVILQGAFALSLVENVAARTAVSRKTVTMSASPYSLRMRLEIDRPKVTDRQVTPSNRKTEFLTTESAKRRVQDDEKPTVTSIF